MHILILPSWYPPQGGSFFKTQAKALKKNGYQVGVIYLEEYSIKKIIQFLQSKHKYKVRRYNEEGIITFRMAWIRIPIFEWLNLLLRIPFYRRLCKSYIMQVDKPDLIHAHSALWGGFFAAKLKKEYNIPYVITEHRGRFNIKNKLVNTELKTWFSKPINLAICEAEKVIGVSSNIIAGLKKLVLEEVSQEKFTTIPNLFEPEYLNFEICRQTSPDSLRLLNIAVFMPAKNQILLIKAIESLLGKGFKNIEVYFAGDGSTMKKNKQYVIKNKLTKNIHFLGYCNKQVIAEQLQKCDYMILPSLTEGQPITILESYAMGVPVIVPNIVTEDIVGPDQGFIYETGDQEDLENTIIKASLRRNSFNPNELRKFASNNFSEETIISRIFSVYKEIVDKG